LIKGKKTFASNLGGLLHIVSSQLLLRHQELAFKIQ